MHDKTSSRSARRLGSRKAVKGKGKERKGWFGLDWATLGGSPSYRLRIVWLCEKALDGHL